MPKFLEADEVDVLSEEVDTQIEEESWRVGPTDGAPDLSDGGMVNGVRVRPARDKTVTKGRANARRTWMWNGTESSLPVAWDPDGKISDGAKRHLLKRYCLCCKTGGFKTRLCPKCVQTGCGLCHGSSDPKKVIKCFYLRKEDVPFPAKFYGSIDCFLPFCVRTGGRGFLTQEDMRMHARSRHRTEYLAHQEVQAASRTDEVETLRRRLDDVMAMMAKGGTTAQEIEAKPLKRERSPAQKAWALELANRGKLRREQKTPAKVAT